MSAMRTSAGHSVFATRATHAVALAVFAAAAGACAPEELGPPQDSRLTDFAETEASQTFEIGPLDTTPSETGAPFETSEVGGGDDDGFETGPDVGSPGDTSAPSDTLGSGDSGAPGSDGGDTSGAGDAGDAGGADDTGAPNDVPPTASDRCGEDLFLSEYVEGASWNKALEIANFTGHDVDLSGYGIWKITNGGDWTEGATRELELAGVLAHMRTFVVCHEDSAPSILARCDLPTAVDMAEFNGDDALALVRNGAIIDVIGAPGADPGAGWAIGGVAEATADHTLRRVADVVEGVEDWGAAERTWQVLEQDVVGDLGAFTTSATCAETRPQRAVVNEVAAATGGADFVELAALAGVGQQSTLAVGGWVVATTSGRYTFPAGATIPVGGFRFLAADALGFALGENDRVWLYDDEGALQDVVGWGANDLAAGASLGRLPDLDGSFAGNTVATPGAANRNPAWWCGDGTCQDDEDCRACPGDCAVCHPGPGDLVISEVMADPKVGPEWFELVNVSGAPLDLAELVVRDDALDFHVLAGHHELARDGILVMASGPMASAAGDAYVFGGVALEPDRDELVIEWRGIEVDRVAWVGLPPEGVAWSLSEGLVSASDNDDAADWCPAVGALTAGQRGSPGAPNPSCASCGDGACAAGETCATCREDCGACPADGCASDLFFSEYVEGSSYNKALEIVNVTGAPVDLSRYAIWRITNGGSTWTALTQASRVALAGTLAHGGVWIGCNASSDPELLAKCPLTFGQGSAPTNFNGDDALALAKDGVIIDVIGVESVDPGDAWDAGGVSEATAGHTLVRKPAVASGNPEWTTAAGEWLVLPEDTFDGLGAHAVDFDCGP